MIQLFDSWAHHLSPGQFAEFSKPYADRVAAALKAKYPLVPVIFHANGGAPAARRDGGGAASRSTHTRRPVQAAHARTHAVLWSA